MTVYWGSLTHKTYLKISTSYYWPKMIQDVERHKNVCLCCQQWKKSTNKWTPLVPVPIPDRPNLWINADLFGPTITADSHKKFVLCITDAFTKYAVLTAIASKDAEMVADAIYTIGFQNLGLQPRFTRMAERNLSTSSWLSFSNYSRSAITKLLLCILSAILKWRFSTKL